MYYTLSRPDAEGTLIPGSRVLVENITSMPAARSINVADAASGLGLSVGDLALGDVITISFDEVISNQGEYDSGATVAINIIDTNVPFTSALDGAFTCVTTVTSQGAGIGWDDCAGNTWEGTVEWVRVHTDPEADGVYQVLTTAASGDVFDDISHGSYYACYGTDSQASLPNTGLEGGGDLQMNDADGVISITGASQWGEVWSVNALSVDGANLTLTLTNDYGEGGISVLTRTDGTEWPADLSN